MNKYEQIINYYRQQIVDKVLKPGDQLPNEIEIAQAFKVSRMTANKALNILGPRIQKYSYTVYQLTSGLSGDVGFKDWTWDGYASFSRAKFDNEQLGGASASVKTFTPDFETL